MKLIINKNEIRNKHFYDINSLNSNENPEVLFAKKSKEYYTYCMIDISIPDKNKHNKTEWLHWLVVNCNNTSKKIIVPYSRPTPQKNTGIHKYFFCLYKQTNIIDMSEIEDNYENRLNFEFKDCIFLKKINWYILDV